MAVFLTPRLECFDFRFVLTLDNLLTKTEEFIWPWCLTHSCRVWRGYYPYFGQLYLRDATNMAGILTRRNDPTFSTSPPARSKWIDLSLKELPSWPKPNTRIIILGIPLHASYPEDSLINLRQVPFNHTRKPTKFRSQLTHKMYDHKSFVRKPK